MCNVPSLGDVVGGLTRGLESLARGVGLTSGNIGLPTMAELSGEEAAKEVARQQAAQQAEFDAQQQQYAEDQRNAQIRRSRNVAVGGRQARGRASTLLTGSQGVLDSGPAASRTLLGQ